MASSDPPFKVKALFDYSSPHEDDLNFPADTVVTVTAIEDDDWYYGEYIDRASGERKEGIFPKNFVERLVVEVPARPARAAKKKPAAIDEPQMPPTSPTSPPLDKPNPTAHETQPPPPPPPPPPQPSPPSPSHPSPEESKPAPLKPAVETTAPRSPALTTKPPPPPPPAATGKPPPPPPDKPSSSSFKDRLALFNKGGAAPVTPYNQLKPRPDFVKKPFIPPPPSKNAYIPPAVSHIPKPRRDEDTRPPPPPPSASVDEPERDPDQETKPKQSLKERIAMLQTQQLDPSALAAGKPKPRPKPKSRSSDLQPEEAAEPLSPLSTNNPENPTDEGRASGGGEREAPAAVPPAATVPPPRSKRSIDIRREDIPDDLSVGDTDRSSVSIGPREARLRHPAATATHQSDFGDDEGANDTPDVPDSDEDEEDGEDDKDDNGDDAEEVDPEVARKLALRERMMKMSGGMGMHGMFGPPMGMPMAAGGPAAPAATTKKNKRKKEGTTTSTSAKLAHAADEERLHEPEIPLPPVPVLPFVMPRVQSPPAVQKESDLGHDGDHADAKHALAGRKISQDFLRDEAVDIDMKPSQSHSDKPHGPRPMPPRSPPGALGGS